MLARMLGRHSQVQDLRELHFIEQMVSGDEFSAGKALEHGAAVKLASRLLSVIREGYFKAGSGKDYQLEAEALVASLPQPSAAALFEAVRFSEARRMGKEIPIDQTPRNVFYIREILEAYPEARILVMVRDPRDVCLSQKGKWRRRFLGADIPLMEALRSWANYHPLVTAKIWRQAVIAGGKIQDPRVLSVRFEDVTADPKGVMHRICAHIGIPFETDMLNVARLGSSDRKDEAGSSGVDDSRVGTWQQSLSNAEIVICETVAGECLEQHGYQPSQLKANWLRRALWVLLLPFKMALSLVLNVKRVRSLISWARKRFLGGA